MALNPFECVKKIKKLGTVSSDDYIMIEIKKYIEMNLNQGRSIMITFVHRDLEKGNQQADVLGKFEALF